MVSTDRLLAFAAMSFLLIVVPGPSVLFVIGRALAQGRRAALTTVVGNTIGAYVLVVAVALGIGSVVERSVVVFTALKLAGAAYLMYLGVKAWRQRGALQAALASDSVWGLVAATARGWFARSPRRLSLVGGVGGPTMVGLGVTVAATGRKD
ncbi:LysE family translocator [Streptomyces montanus]|uniref:LysE family translocator n=1 Tax=Streptomyces montanus TaxID=2580423 RepID=A0A5R9FS65_9ACTN|nr:LysE family translocator [Streptomyces montanus]TLS46221.1 LysE family translocator [Streptomyces montanus]